MKTRQLIESVYSTQTASGRLARPLHVPSTDRQNPSLRFGPRIALYVFRGVPYNAPMTAAYETHLNHDLQWALREGSMFFEEKGGLHRTLQRIVKRCAI